MLLSVASAIGLNVKEKLSEERECGTESGRENGRSLIQSGRERGG